MGYELDNLKRLADNLGRMFGKRCEIVIHDFTEGYERTIVHIVNGELSGREIGGCPTSLFFEQVPDLQKYEEKVSEYFSKTADGRVIKSSTTFLRDDAGSIAGSICVNLDVTEFYALQQELGQFLNTPEKERKYPEGEKFVRNVQELMDACLDEVEREIGKPALRMNREEKLRALSYLDSRGVLQINKAGVRLCEFFGISKFTLYHYLDEIRNVQAQEGANNEEGTTA